MPSSRSLERRLGTMIAFGFPRGDVAVDLDLASRMGVSCLEILPDWGRRPDPLELLGRVRDSGLEVHSVHGCWGGQSIEAYRVDLASLDEAVWQASVDDLRRCLDWLNACEGRHLVVHPGGLSQPEDAEARSGRPEDRGWKPWPTTPEGPTCGSASRTCRREFIRDREWAT